MSYRRLLGAWLALAVLMPVNGALREFALKRVLIAPAADAISAALGIALILLITGAVFRIAPETPRAALWRMSAVLVTLTIAYEVAIGLLGGQSWQAMAANYAIWRGAQPPNAFIPVTACPRMSEWMSCVPS